MLTGSTLTSSHSCSGYARERSTPSLTCGRCRRVVTAGCSTSSFDCGRCRRVVTDGRSTRSLTCGRCRRFVTDECFTRSLTCVRGGVVASDADAVAYRPADCARRGVAGVDVCGFTPPITTV